MKKEKYYYQKNNGIIKTELKSLTWIVDTDINDKLFVTCKYKKNFIKFEGEYRPFDIDNNNDSVNIVP